MPFHSMLDQSAEQLTIRIVVCVDDLKREAVCSLFILDFKFGLWTKIAIAKTLSMDELK